MVADLDFEQRFCASGIFGNASQKMAENKVVDVGVGGIESV